MLGAATVYFGSGDSPVFALKHFEKSEDFFFFNGFTFFPLLNVGLLSWDCFV